MIAGSVKLSGAKWNNLNTIKIKSNLMAGVKSVQMFYDVFHENSVHSKEDMEGLSKLFKWNIHVKNNMIINWYIAEMLKPRWYNVR